MALRENSLDQNKPARTEMRAGQCWVNRCLVDQLNCKLELSARECVSDLTEILGAEVSADAAAVLVTFELGVVKEVEALRT